LASDALPFAGMDVPLLAGTLLQMFGSLHAGMKPGLPCGGRTAPPRAGVRPDGGRAGGGTE